MKLQIHTPRKELSEVVKSIWVFEDSGLPETSPFKVVPFGSFDLLFQMRNSCWQSFDGDQWVIQPKVMMTGQFEKYVFIKPSGAFKTIGISLHPWCGKFFCSFPLNRITTGIIGGEELDRLMLYEYWNRFAEAKDNAQIFELAEKLIQTKLSSYKINKSVAHVIKEIQRKPTIDLKAAFETIPYSHRRIEQIFLEEVGISPKFYRKKNRFQLALKLMDSTTNFKTLTDLTYAAGYYDQSKFIRDFRFFTGETPKSYLKSNDNLGADFV